MVFHKDRIDVWFVWRAFALAVLVVALPLSAEAKTGIRLLDQPAIAVKAPDRVVLIAVTRAGSRMVAVGEHGVIVYSDDDGKSWVQGRVPVDVTLTAVAFATPQKGWAVGQDGVILHTNDAGVTWQEQLNGIQANQLTMAAAQAAVASNDPSVGTVHAMARAEHFAGEGPANPFLTLLVEDQSHAIVFGAYRLAMKTSDGGRTWTDWSLHVGDPLSHNLYDAAFIGADWFVVGEAGLVFRSSNGGQSFTAVTSPGPNTLFGVSATGDGDVLVYGVAGVAFRSADDGATWQAVDLHAADNLTASVVMHSGLIVIGSESGILYTSRDRGRSFRVFPTPQPQAIFGLAAAPDGDLVVVGSGGVDVVPGPDLSRA